MKIALFGNKISTQAILDRLIELGYDVVVYQVSSSKSRSVSGYHRIQGAEQNRNVRVRVVDDYSLRSDSDSDHFKKVKYDVGICAGWQRLLPESVLNTFRFGVFGWHGSPFYFPNGRGRSPLNWSLRLGLSEVNLYCLRYNSDADEGDIMNLSRICINKSCSISDLQKYTLPIILKDLDEILDRCKNNFFSLNTQSNKAFISFPKLKQEDGELKIGLQSAEQFINIIKATSRPFPGAFIYLQGQMIKIWDGDLFLRPHNGKIFCQNNEIKLTNNALFIGFKDQILISKDYECVDKSLKL